MKTLEIAMDTKKNTNDVFILSATRELVINLINL